MHNRALSGWMVALFAVGLGGCGGEEGAVDEEPGFELLDIGAEDPELGKALFEPAAAPDGKEDSVSARKGLPVSVDSGAAAVWTVRNHWADTNTAEARKAGMAWPANSGLTWDQKFSAWVQAMPRSSAHHGGSTFQLMTPYGKTLPGPSLECAEVAMFLRATFASWYGLPFFVEAGDANGRIFLGHFGFLNADGSRYRTTPAFKTAYRDHSNLAETWQSAGWPKDNTLRGRRLGGSQDDFQPALFPDAHAGAYFDELYLNKRTGYFMILLLSYFGSINLADPSNTFNLDPTAIRAGDPLVHRWQRRGIGHVYVVKQVEPIAEGRIAAEVISGSMPRRQPVWENAAASQSAFLSNSAGGAGEASDGNRYATLGGGLKRWRTPVVDGGRWTNVVPVADRQKFVDAGNATAMAARLDTFRGILGQLSVEERLNTLMEQIEAARAHLRRYPASCSARTRRETAFSKLYELMDDEHGMSRAEVDSEYRAFEDYVLAELVYNQSKTCCWNSSTSAMYEIIMDKAQKDAERNGDTCQEPPVFKATGGGYDLFKLHAQEIGRGGEWVAWSADETCPQANTTDDSIAPSEITPHCEARSGHNGGGAVPGYDAYEPNDTRASAAVVEIGRLVEAVMAEGDVDFFAVDVPSAGSLNVELRFRHHEGDLDLEVYAPGGDRVGVSNSTGDTEQVTLNVSPGRYTIKVLLYGSSAGEQRYTLTTAHAGGGGGGASAGADRFEPNDTPAQAATIGAGRHEGLTQCGDPDYYRVEVARTSALKVRLTFTHAAGDLDLRLLDAQGAQLASSAGLGNEEQVERSVGPGAYLVEVIRYGQATTQCQPYALEVSGL